jgi:hypothetical protein
LVLASAAHPATGRFSGAQADGVWGFLDPDEQPFVSAIGGLRPEGTYAPSLGRSEDFENILGHWGSEAAWLDQSIS